MKRLVVSLGLGLFAVIATAAPVTSVPGVVFPGSQAEIATAFRLSRDSVARKVVLSSPDESERSRLKAAPLPSKRMPLKIGFARDVPASASRIELSTLAWHALPGGVRAAQVEIEAPTAAAVRVELALVGDATGLKFRFAGSSSATVFGPQSWPQIVAAGHLSPILDGAVATIEIEAAESVALAGKALLVPRISHLAATSAEIASGGLKRVPEIGSSGSCNVDIACVPNPSTDLLRASSATAQIAFTKTDGSTYLCSGTLLNSTDVSGQPTLIPYFATANHCVGTEIEAATLTFYWFFEAAACNSQAAPNFATTTGGASMLYTSYDVDFTLVRMNSDPPAGVLLAGWDAGPVFPSANVVALHHPQGDLKKFSAGLSVDYAHDFDNLQNPPLFEPQGNYLRIRWSQGTTEVGSSGSGVFTRNAQSGEYQMRGVLHGGDASCFAPTDLDYYSRFDLAFPSISQHLAGTPQPEAGGNAIEYYNVDLDHYFMTSFPEETDFVETGGAGRGWVRTGYSFPIASSASAASVCRFYGNPDVNPATGQRRGPNSHFYTADPGECAFVKLDPGWVYEAIAFNVRVPANQACPAGTTPVMRLYNNGFATNNSNHRYTTSSTVYQFMLTQQWSGEQTVMCAP